MNGFSLSPVKSSRCVRGGVCRTGAATLEAILVVPVLVIVTVAAIQFAVTLVVEQSIAHTATVAAREAAKETALPTNTASDIADELVDVVNTMLAPHKLAVGPSVSFALEIGGSPTQTRGSLACDPPSQPTVGPDEVRVSVCVRLDTAPFPNLLSGFDIDVANRCLRRSSLVKKE